MGKTMGRPKLDTAVVTFRMSKDAIELLKADAATYGVTVGAYVSVLAAQKRIEKQAMTFVSNIPPDKLRKMLTEDDK